MTFPHTHRKHASSRAQLIEQARKDNVLPECFVYSAKLILKNHIPKNDAQRSTNRLLSEAILSYYKSMPNEHQKPNPSATKFKEFLLTCYTDQLQEACVLVAPGINRFAENRITMLALDAVKQSESNRRKKRSRRRRK